MGNQGIILVQRGVSLVHVCFSVVHSGGEFGSKYKTHILVWLEEAGGQGLPTDGCKESCCE